jgi:hypothetical protein
MADSMEGPQSLPAISPASTTTTTSERRYATFNTYFKGPVERCSTVLRGLHRKYLNI